MTRKALSFMLLFLGVSLSAVIPAFAQSDDNLYPCGLPSGPRSDRDYVYVDASAVYTLTADCAMLKSLSLETPADNNPYTVTINGNGHSITQGGEYRQIPLIYVRSSVTLYLNDVTIEGVGMPRDSFGVVSVRGSLDATNVTFRNNWTFSIFSRAPAPPT